MTGALDWLCSNYDSGAATVSDGENDEDPSHGSQSKNDRAAGYLASQSHAILSAMSQDDDDDDPLDEMASTEIEDHHKQRNSESMDQHNHPQQCDNYGTQMAKA